MVSNAGGPSNPMYQPSSTSPTAKVTAAPTARKTPNGTSFPVLRLIGPKMSEPVSAPRKIVSIAPTGPRKAPIIALIFMSPPPLAGFLNTRSPASPTPKRTRKPTAAPPIASRGVGVPGRSDRASPAASPPMLSGSGIR